MDRTFFSNGGYVYVLGFSDCRILEQQFAVISGLPGTHGTCIYKGSLVPLATLEVGACLGHQHNIEV